MKKILYSIIGVLFSIIGILVVIIVNRSNESTVIMPGHYELSENLYSIYDEMTISGSEANRLMNRFTEFYPLSIIVVKDGKEYVFRKSTDNSSLNSVAVDNLKTTIISIRSNYKSKLVLDPNNVVTAIRLTEKTSL